MNTVGIRNVRKLKFMITTKTGDQGQTTCDNKRIDKDDLLVEVVGTIDELQAHLGLIKINCKTAKLNNQIDLIQKDLMNINGELACGMKFENLAKRISEIEDDLEAAEKELPELKEFVIPGKNLAEAETHVCRTVCRRTERRIVGLYNRKKINKEIIKYFNRLSDYLFIISRII
jgi:cob(I)alamin adenosyltransferase